MGAEEACNPPSGPLMSGKRSCQREFCPRTEAALRGRRGHGARQRHTAAAAGMARDPPWALPQAQTPHRASRLYKAPSIDLSLNKKVITICKTRLAVPSSIYKLWFICTKPQYKQERNTRTENLSTKKLHLHSLSPAVVHVCMTERTCRFFAAPYDLITLRQINPGYLK